MAIRAVRPLMAARQWVPGVIVGPEAEGGGIGPMTGGAVALRHLALELPPVVIGVAQLARVRRRDKTADRCILRHDVATKARNGGVRSGERIEGPMLGGVIPCGQEPLLLVAIGALGMAGTELPPMRVLVTGLTRARHGGESARAGVRIGRMAFRARHTGMGAS